MATDHSALGGGVETPLRVHDRGSLTWIGEGLLDVSWGRSAATVADSPPEPDPEPEPGLGGITATDPHAGYSNALGLSRAVRVVDHSLRLSDWRTRRGASARDMIQACHRRRAFHHQRSEADVVELHRSGRRRCPPAVRSARRPRPSTVERVRRNLPSRRCRRLPSRRCG